MRGNLRVLTTLLVCVVLLQSFSLANQKEDDHIFREQLEHREALEKQFSESRPIEGDSYNMDAGPVKENSQPLMEYLNEQPQEVYSGAEDETAEDKAAREQLQQMDQDLNPLATNLVDTSYNYNIDVTDENEKKMNDASTAFSKSYHQCWNDLISTYDTTDLSDFYKRQFLMQRSIGTAILDNATLTQLNNHIGNMVGVYSSARVCKFNDMKCDEETEGYDIDTLEGVMATNRDYSELLYYWEKWRDNSGKEMVDDFEQYVQLMNQAAVGNDFEDAGEMWIDPYTTFGPDLYPELNYTADNFKSDIEQLWNETKDYYSLLHDYVSYKLQQDDDYGDYIDEDENLIPAHILGNMWAQSWENIYDLVAPYPDVPLPDISHSLQQNSTVEEMFKIAENFYLSLDMYKMTDDFWKNSMLQDPGNRTVVCHASAWDFYSNGPDNKDDGRYRIKMCTDRNQDDFIVIHHEMGHIEYFTAYSNYFGYPEGTSPNNSMPLIYRDGANPGFHEAIGDTIALSVSTPSHLNKIEKYLTGFNQSASVNDTLQNINYLMKQALAKIAFLPYAYILDLWRWDVFSGAIDKDVYNKAWWERRIDYQGIRPPISRSPDSDFDIGCKYHVPANVPYIRYFVAYILQFQFHEKLCEVAGQGGNISYCDIYNSKDAGHYLLGMLSKGASLQWQEQLGEFLGTDGRMNSSAIIEYFDPLWEYLEKYLADNKVKRGWSPSADVIDDYINDSEDISAVVPIIVGVVLAVLVAIVLVAFFLGQRKRKKMEKEREEEKDDVIEKGKNNHGLELEETKEDL